MATKRELTTENDDSRRELAPNRTALPSLGLHLDIFSVPFLA